MQFAPVHSRVCQLGKVLLQRRGLRLWHGWGPPLASFRLAAAAYARPCRLSGLVTSSTFHAFTCVCPSEKADQDAVAESQWDDLSGIPAVYPPPSASVSPPTSARE